MIVAVGSPRSTNDPAPAGFFPSRTVRRAVLASTLLASTLLALMAGSATAAEDRDTARARLASLASTCAACHGTDGRVPAGSPIPGLAAKPAALLAQQMRDYRSGARSGTIMPQLARGYSDDQIDRLAEWFARQPAGGAR